MKSKKVAVILSGCGYLDGSEINEAVLTLLEIDRNNAKYSVFAPDIEQVSTVNHISKAAVITGEKRNVLIESARIARGNIRSITELDHDEFDALILPGGFGVACNLSNIATKGNDCNILPEINRVVLDFFDAKKPIGAICISPALLAKILSVRSKEIILTLGNHNQLLVDLGIKQIPSAANEIVVDDKNKLVSSPAFMLEARISDIAIGISKLVNKVLSMI